MKASTVIRAVAKQHYGSNFTVFNDRMKDGRRNIKVNRWSQREDVNFMRDALKALRDRGFEVTLNPREYRFWVWNKA